MLSSGVLLIVLVSTVITAADFALACRLPARQHQGFRCAGLCAKLQRHQNGEMDLYLVRAQLQSGNGQINLKTMKSLAVKTDCFEGLCICVRVSMLQSLTGHHLYANTLGFAKVPYSSC